MSSYLIAPNKYWINMTILNATKCNAMINKLLFPIFKKILDKTLILANIFERKITAYIPQKEESRKKAKFGNELEFIEILPYWCNIINIIIDAKKIIVFNKKESMRLEQIWMLK